VASSQHMHHAVSCLNAGLSFRFMRKALMVCDAHAQLGAAEVSAIAAAWGDRLQSLTLIGPALAATFFPAVAKHLPGLRSLSLVNIPDATGDMSVRIMAFCSRLTRPLKLALPPDLLK
jgi:hypothetical protein